MSIFEILGTALYNLWSDFLQTIASLLPDAGSSSVNFSNAISMIMTTAYQFSFVIDWSLLFTCLGIVILCELSILAIRFGLFLAGLIRGGH